MADIAGKRNVRGLFIVKDINEHTPRSIRARELIRHLAPIANLDVVSMTQRHHIDDRQRGVRYFLLPFLTKNDIYRQHPIILLQKLWHAVTKKRSLYSTDAGRIKRLIKRKLSGNAYDFVCVVVTPFAYYGLALFLKKTFPGAKLVYDIGDPFLKNIGLCADTAQQRRIARFEGSALSLCDLIVVTNENTKALFHDDYGLPADKMLVLPAGVKLPETLKKSQVSGSIKMAYAGLLYEGRGIRNPDPLFRAIDTMPGQCSLTIFGGTHSYRSPHIRYEASRPYNDILAAYQEFDVLVFLDNKKGAQTPSKIFEYIAAQKPILFVYEDEDSETKIMLENQDYRGVEFTANRAECILTAIEKLISEYDAYTFDYDIGQESWCNRADRLLEFIGG